MRIRKKRKRMKMKNRQRKSLKQRVMPQTSRRRAKSMMTSKSEDL
jgi:hypothetical protein